MHHPFNGKDECALGSLFFNNSSRPLQHEERLSRVFDEVMGLGDFADSSRGSATSSRSGGPEDTKGIDKSSGQGEHQQVEEEEDSNGSRQDEKMDEGMGEPSFPRISSTSSDQHPMFTLGTSEGGGTGRSGGAAFDDALDGMEDDEDWHFAMPMDSLDDAQVSEASSRRSQSGVGDNIAQGNPFAHQAREDDDEEEEEEDSQEREGSSESTNTSHSSQDHTPDNSQGETAFMSESRSF